MPSTREEFYKRKEEYKSIKKESTYTKVKEVLSKNKDKAYTRNELIDTIFGEIGEKERGYKYDEIAFALNFLEQEERVEDDGAGLNRLYIWKEE